MPKKVLLVDDSNTALLMEQMILNQRTHYDLVTAQNGLEAVEKSVSERPDLILMDVVMPQMDGFRACEEIRKNLSTREIPIILVTTRGEADFVETGFNCGCNDFITKPLNPSELVQLVKNYLEE
ncbi:MAG: response regulator [Acidobacteriia bacterium]|nr:response regulator [Terriglobia bacterium]